MVAFGISLGGQAREASREAQEASREARQARAESQERFNQLAGRLKLTESRNQGMLAATDADRQELKRLYQELDERLKALEERLSA